MCAVLLTFTHTSEVDQLREHVAAACERREVARIFQNRASPRTLDSSTDYGNGSVFTSTVRLAVTPIPVTAPLESVSC